MYMQPDYSSGTAVDIACAGWQVVVEADDVIVAGSTGTRQATFTPEAPPTMEQSPVPNSEESVFELLTLSPRLSESEIREHRVSCE